MITAKITFNKHDSGYSLIGFDHDGESFPSNETVDFVMKDAYDELREKYEKAVEALKFYEDSCLYGAADDKCYPLVFDDEGKLARQTLKDLEEL